MLARLFLLLLVFGASSSYAQSDDTPVRLKVKPVLCITDERTPACEMSFLVLWESEETGYYCLFNDMEASALRCWTDESAGELDDQRTVRDPFSYWMTGADDALLAAVKVEVLRMESADRRRKRRNRHVWDIL